MTPIKRTLTGLVAAAALALALAPSASAAEATCPGSFEVLHNDRIGAMQLPAGPYTITVLDTATMGCTEASQLFTQFLEDWDGRLPRPWVANNATRTFTAGRGSSVGFRVTQGAPTPADTAQPAASALEPRLRRLLHGAAQRSHRQLLDPEGPLPDHAARLLGRHLLAGLHAVRPLPAGLRRHPAAAVVRRPDHRQLHEGQPPHRLPDQAVRRRRRRPRTAVAIRSAGRLAARPSASSTTTASAGSSCPGAPTTSGCAAGSAARSRRGCSTSSWTTRPVTCRRRGS